jgi:hypothetical protein
MDGPEDKILTWPNGLFVTDYGGERFSLNRESKPFLSCGLTRVRAGTALTPSIYVAGNHRRVGRTFPTVKVQTEDAYLTMIHSHNVSGRRSTRRQQPLDAKWRDVLEDRFGIYLSLKL